MSSFSSRVQKTIELPDDQPHTVLIRKLNRKQFITAEKAQRATFFTDIKAQFGSNWQQEIKNFKTDDQPKDVKEAAKDPLLQFDVDILLKYGIKAWTFEDVPLTDESLADLDKDTGEFIAREVLRLTAPKLFESYEGEEQKNGSAPSGAA